MPGDNKIKVKIDERAFEDMKAKLVELSNIIKEGGTREALGDIVRLVTEMDFEKYMSMSIKESANFLEKIRGHLEKIREEARKTKDVRLEDAFEAIEKSISKIRRDGEPKLIDIGEVGGGGIGRRAGEVIGTIPGLPPELTHIISLLGKAGPWAVGIEIFRNAVKMFDSAVKELHRIREVFAIPTAGGGPGAQMGGLELTRIMLRMDATIHRLTGGMMRWEQAASLLGSLRGAGAYQELRMPTGETFGNFLARQVSVAPEMAAEAISHFVTSVFNLSRRLGISGQEMVNQLKTLNRLQLDTSLGYEGLSVQIYQLATQAQRLEVSVSDYMKWTETMTKELRYYGIDVMDSSSILKYFTQELKTGVFTIEDITKVLKQTFAPSMETSALFLEYLGQNYDNLSKGMKSFYNLMIETPVPQLWSVFTQLARGGSLAREKLQELSKALGGSMSGNVASVLKGMESIIPEFNKQFLDFQKTAIQQFTGGLPPALGALIPDFAKAVGFPGGENTYQTIQLILAQIKGLEETGKLQTTAGKEEKLTDQALAKQQVNELVEIKDALGIDGTISQGLMEVKAAILGKPVVTPTKEELEAGRITTIGLPGGH